jgi:hypothetical protein
MAAAAGVAAVFATLFLGNVPYVRNVVEKGDPFYPLSPRLGLDQLVYQRPVNLSDRNRLSRFLISNFSQTEALRPPRGTRLKIPFWITENERSSAYPADLESAGFGPLYGGLLVLSAIAAFALVAQRSHRRVAGAAVLIGCCVLASVFVHGETWWARFVPQAWLFPLLLAIPGLCSLRRSPQWWLGSTIVTLATVNLLMVGFSVARREWVAARNVRTGLRAMSASAQPVTVYFGPFPSLRRRLTEAGIRFTTIDMPPQAHEGRQTIAAPGEQAFWLKPADHNRP